MTDSTAVIQAQTVHFTLDSPSGYGYRDEESVYYRGVTLPSSQPQHQDRRNIITSSDLFHSQNIKAFRGTSQFIF